jgi:hypothetical protein
MTMRPRNCYTVLLVLLINATSIICLHNREHIVLTLQLIIVWVVCVCVCVCVCLFVYEQVLGDIMNLNVYARLAVLHNDWQWE